MFQDRVLKLMYSKVEGLDLGAAPKNGTVIVAAVELWG